MAARETAWRVTARELESSLEEEKGAGERSPTYLVSPFGARMSRVLLAGTLSPGEPIGRDPATAFWRARFSDATGAVAVTAGSFQPRAMAQVRSATASRPAVVVGRTHLYRGRDGVASVSVRAEGVRSLAEGEERGLLADIVRQTLDRLDLVERLEKEPHVAEAALRADGVPSAWIRAGREALRRYPNADRGAFRRELRSAIRHVAGEFGPVRSPSPTPGSVTRTVARPAGPAAPPPTAEERGEESVFLGLVDEVSERSADGYADLKEVILRSAERGLASARAEAALSRLEEEGVLEEPIVGKLRRAE